MTVFFRFFHASRRLCQSLDRSRVPRLDENELTEQFIRGSGPGGSNVAALKNCVLLKHRPTGAYHRRPYSSQQVDFSRVPRLVEDDLEEQFVKGSGPGGQNVNKLSNCVVLKHKPTGLIVKCHQSRLLATNRKLAREIMVTKLDNLLNGDMSVESQLKAIRKLKDQKMENKRKKLSELKEKWKEREGE